MRFEDLQIQVTQLPGAMPVWHGCVDADQWREACLHVRDAGGRLVALWGTDDTDRGAALCVHVALAWQSRLMVLSLPAAKGSYPDIAAIFPSANRMQRAVHDLLGLRADGAVDQRKWLRHAAWQENTFPLRRDFDDAATCTNGVDAYPFVKVEGEGVHEIPVGPVHAGTIEPGHFRFSVVGEGVLKLEERLGYKHKGIEKRFESMTLAQGARLAGRVSGDSTVAYAWAYAMAVEGVTGISPPPRALWLRALFLERERIGQHLWDLGYMGNDAGLAFGLAQFSRLREDMLRTNAALFGHRYLMDVICPGGVARDVDADGIDRIRHELKEIAKTVVTLRAIYIDHAGLQDRFVDCGRIRQDHAARLGLGGLAGRASGVACDLRAQIPSSPYDELGLNMVVRTGGDVAARATVRADEIVESLRLIERILSNLPSSDIWIQTPDAPEYAFGVGWVEGWRGEVLIALETGAANRIRRCHPHDPSWQNWPLLERAVLGNIVPDFPLINKSFNLSYSGQDL